MGGSSGPSAYELEQQAKAKAEAQRSALLNREINTGIASKAATGSAERIGGEDRLGIADVEMIKTAQSRSGRSAFGRGATVLSSGIGTTPTGTKTLLGV
jgi:hypothetical protein